MKKQGILARVVAGAAGGALLLGGASAAFAAEQNEDNADVNVNVNIAEVEPVGALTLTVDGNSTSLSETTDAADTQFREFEGTLPNVTVTDDRATVPAGSFWYVNGQSSDFTAQGGSTIGAENLGWAPKVTEDSGDGAISEGDLVPPALDASTAPVGAVPNNVGLKGQELLALAIDADAANATGSWSANAALKLKTLASVTPGNYTAKITLTLWSDVETTPIP